MSHDLSEPPATDRPAPPHKIGIVFGEMGRIRLPALKYLIVHLNTLQSTFEFELLPTPRANAVIRLLDGKSDVNLDAVRGRLGEFHGDLKTLIDKTVSKLTFPLAVETIPGKIVLLTMGLLEDGYYTVGDRNVRAVALGRWERELAPPSILEFFITLLLRQSIALISRSFRASGHLGTKGCLFDFTDDLGDARFKAMQGFLCSDCRRLLAVDDLTALVDPLVPVLDTRSWLGSPSDPKTPAGIVAKLGHDLFLTRGVEPSWGDIFKSKLRDDGVKEVIRIIALLIAAALLVMLGLKSAS